MKEPERLIHCGATDWERRLLEAAVSEEPSAATARRVAVAVGISTAVGLTANAAVTAATLPKLWLAKLQWLGVTLGAGGLAWVAYHTFRPTASDLEQPSTTASTPAPAPRPSPARQKETIAEATDPEPVTLQAPAPTVEGSLAPGSAPPRAATRESVSPQAPATEPAAEPTPRSASIAAEVAAIDSARRALSRGDASQALRELNNYQAQYPHGVLGQEAALLRIEALAQAGNIGAAKALARRFFFARPHSPHKKRIESIVGSLGPVTSGSR